jgi:hypothetical protein
MWSSLPKTQTYVVIVTLCYRPCDNTPSALTASACSCNGWWSIVTSVYRKGEHGNKKEYFFKLSSNTPPDSAPVIRATVVEVGVSSHEL